MDAFWQIPLGILTVVILLWAILTFVPYRKYTHERQMEAKADIAAEMALFLFIVTIPLTILLEALFLGRDRPCSDD